MKTGIYKIENKVNGKVYIGQSKSIEIRWEHHKNRLRSGKHHSNHLQRAWDKYGSDNFDFSIIEECELCDLNKRETYWIKAFKSGDRNFGYNGTQDENSITKLYGGKNHASKQVMCDGIEYPSVIDFCTDRELPYSSVRNWLTGNTIMPQKYVDLGLRYKNKEDFVREIKTEDNSNKQKVECDGVVFESINNCAEYLNEHPTTIGAYLSKKTCMPKRYIDRNLRYFEDTDTEYMEQAKPLNESVICGDIRFETISDCCAYYNVSYEKMTGWLSGRRYTPNKFIELGLDYENFNANIRKKPKRIQRGRYIYCDNKVYRSLKVFSLYNKISYGMIKRWMSNLSTNNDLLKELLSKGFRYIEEDEVLNLNLELIDNNTIRNLGFTEEDIINGYEPSFKKATAFKVTNVSTDKEYIFESKKDYIRNGESVMGIKPVTMTTIRKYQALKQPYENLLFEVVD